MTKKEYVILTEEQIDKIGNTLIYLSNSLGEMSKTKILKLLYLLDEISIKKSGIPFFNLQYKVWKYGPVSEEIFIDLNEDLSILKSFISKNEEGNFIAINDFNDDEFSNNDIKLMNQVITSYGTYTVKDLVNITHRENAPWYIAAVENNVLELLNTEKINNTEIVLDFSHLIAHDEMKQRIYKDYLETH
ncbi:Panacea domain-containing protein [Myroides sp. LJL116]